MLTALLASLYPSLLLSVCSHLYYEVQRPQKPHLWLICLGEIDFCDFLWLLIAYRSFQTCRHLMLSSDMSYICRKKISVLIFVSAFIPRYLAALHCPFIPSLPPSLPRCRLNLFLFIVSSSSSGAGLWVSMLRGSRRSCLCCVVHYNLLYVLKRRKKGPCHVMNKRRKVCGICLLTLDQYFP